MQQTNIPARVMVFLHLRVMALASIVILALAFLVPLEIADARVNTNSAPQSAPMYENPHVVVPEASDDEGKDDGFDWIGALSVILDIPAAAALLAPLLQIIWIFHGDWDFVSKFPAEIKELITKPGNSKSKRRAIGIFVLVMALCILVLVREFINMHPTFDLVQLSIGVAVYGLYGAVVVSALPAKLYLERKLRKERESEEDETLPGWHSNDY